MQDVAKTLLEAMNAIGDAFYLLDHEWRFVYVNRMAETLMERPTGSLLGRVVWEEFPPARESIFGREMHRAVTERVAIEFTARYGPLARWFDVRLHPTDGGLAVAFKAANLRVEAEQLRNFEARLTATALEGRGMVALISAAADSIRESADWAVGEAWLLRADGNWSLGAIHTRKSTPQLAEFASASKALALEAGRGLPGLAASQGSLVDFPRLTAESGFVRHEAARAAGLVAGVALPLMDSGRPLAVLAFLNDAPLEDASWRHLLRALQDRIREIVARERSTAMLDQFFQLSSEGIAIVGYDGFFRRVNPALRQMLGWTEAQLVQAPMVELVHPDDLERTMTEMAAVQSGQMAEEFENRLRHGAGGWRRLVWTSRIDPVEGMIYATARDVTDQRHAEAIDECQRQALESLARGDALDAVLTHLVRCIELLVPGARGSILLVRDGAVWMGAAPALPAAFSRAIHGEPIGPVAGSCGTAAWRDAMVIVTDIATDPLWAPYRDLALEHGLVGCWSLPFHDAAGTVIGTLAVYPETSKPPTATDLDAVSTIAKIAAIAVERWSVIQRLQLLETAIEQLNDIVMITEGAPLAEPGPRIQFVNRAFERVTGWKSEAALGQTPRILQSPDTDRHALDRVRAALEEGRPIREEVLNQRPDGTPYWVEMDIAPVRDASGTVTQFVSVERDTTARRQLEDQLRESQKMEAVGRLAGGVAHDFNNMLTAIHGFAELLLLDLADATMQSHAQEIIRAAERSSDLTRKLLAFARRQVLQPQVVDLSVLVGELGQLLERLVGASITQEVLLATAPLPTLVDPGQIEQVILNLAINARDAMPDGGTLTIETAAVHLDEEYAASHSGVIPGDYVMVAVSDTGIGMSAEVRARIFEPFFTTKGDRGGTGLGLSTVLGVVQQSGGHLWVYSEPHEGTTVKAYFRRAAVAAAAPAEIAPPPRTARPATILVVEDEEQLRGLIRRMLEREGYTVLDTGDGADAAPIARQHPGVIDLLLTDVVLPRLNGRLVADAVTKVRPGIPVLYMSGYTENAIVHHGVLKEGIAFLEKPFTRQDLLDRVAGMLPSA